MTSNKDAYDKLRIAKAAAIAGFGAAKTTAASNRFQEAILALDDELDAIIKKNLSKNTSKYNAITTEIKNASSNLDAIAKQAAALVKGTELAKKIASAFGALLPLFALA